MMLTRVAISPQSPIIKTNVTELIVGEVTRVRPLHYYWLVGKSYKMVRDVQREREKERMNIWMIIERKL